MTPGSEQFSRNKYSIGVDIGIGALFFILVKLTDDLPLSALVTAGAGLAVVVAQRFVKVDLLGGLAIFGIVMQLISAGFSWLFDSELAVQLKSTYLGLLGAAFFALDALRGGRYLGRRLSLYVAYDDIDVRKLAWSFAAVGAVMALVNAAIALMFSKDAWLWYTLWGDMVLAVGLSMWAIQRARGAASAAAA